MTMDAALQRTVVVIAYLGCIPLANWMIGHVGVCSLDGPCLLPVGFGLMAPSGVVLAGFALCLRDAVQEMIGRKGAAWTVLAGVALSVAVAPPRLALASGAAFAVSEGLDGMVFSRVRVRGLPAAVFASGALGLVVDSALFLGLAFGLLEHLGGQIVGKAWAVLGATVFIWWRRRNA